MSGIISITNNSDEMVSLDDNFLDLNFYQFVMVFMMEFMIVECLAHF